MEDIVTLVGPRSVGKSTIGKIIAKSLGWEYFDLDAYMDKILSKENGIGGFTRKYGWEKYMEVQHEELKKVLNILKGKKVIFDCGGGVISSPYKSSNKNAEILHANTKIVLILPHEEDEKGLEILYHREKNRPHFVDYSEEKLREKVRKDYFERVPGMKKFARHIIHTKEQPAEVIARLITDFVRKN